MTPKVDAVVVSYNVRDLLVECLASLVVAQAAGEIARIVVIDNGSSDGSADAARRAGPNIQVVEAENHGYGAGANAGIARSDAEYVLVLNPDTVIPAGSIATLTAWLDAHPSHAVVGPRLRRPDGSIQSSRRRFPRPWTPIFESSVIEEWWPRNPVATSYHLSDRSDDVVQDVDWIVGAAMLVRRAAFEQAGGFDESFRMYAEEVEWCWRFQRHGWRVGFVPTTEIVHHEGASAAQDLPRRLAEFNASRVQLTGRLYGRRWESVVRVAILLDYVIRLSRESAKWLLGNRRQLRMERMRFYAAALRRGVRRG